MGDGGQIVLAQILLDEKAVHGGRCAESGDVVFRKQGQQLRGCKLVKVTDKNSRLHKPLSIQLAPHGLHPASIGQGQMQAVRHYIMPIFRGHNVRDGIGIIMPDHFGHTGGARGKIQQHRICSGGLRPFKGIRLAFQLLGKVYPSLVGAVNADFHLNSGRFRKRRVRMVHNLAVSSTDDSLHVSRVEPVYQVFLGQQIRSRNTYRSNLVKSQKGKPKLIVPLQNQHHCVPSADS